MILRPGKTPAGKEIRGNLRRLVRMIRRAPTTRIEATADDTRTRRALEEKPVLSDYAATWYRAKSWKVERRVCARIEATTMGLGIRFVVTNLGEGSAGHIYDVLYCARSQAENLIKMHKSQLASDRTSYCSPCTPPPTG